MMWVDGESRRNVKRKRRLNAFESKIKRRRI